MVPLHSLLFTVVIFHVVMQQFGLPEGLGASRGAALEWVVVKIDGQDRWRLVFDHSVHWKQKSLSCELVTKRRAALVVVACVLCSWSSREHFLTWFSAEPVGVVEALLSHR